MTNSVYFVTGPDHKLEKECGESHHKVLLRIYGSGADQFISRDREMFWLCKMSEKGVAPKLLGAFANGRFEQFLNSTTLTKEDFREPSTSQQIAQQLYKLHQLIHSSDDADEVESTKESDIWNKMRRWQKMAAKEMAKLKKSQPDRYATMKTAVRDMKGIKAEIAQVEQHLHSTGSPLVFAHNDAQYGNVLRLEKDKSLMVVDYEYSSINYRGYDFANHFCEWAADYHSDTPHKMHFDQFPTRDQQLIFFNAYIDAANNDTENNKDEVEKKQDREEQLAFMYKETNKFTLASHLLWGLWGIMQAGETEIDFDYVAYACERFNQYWKTKEEMLKL
ncbi:kinase-like domain-containing protein [Powellomyces hirtus]|nr:kinase-like domain-containing protein [Powellomyces hirtus]